MATGDPNMYALVGLPGTTGSGSISGPSSGCPAAARGGRRCIRPVTYLGLESGRARISQASPAQTFCRRLAALRLARLLDRRLILRSLLESQTRVEVRSLLTQEEEGVGLTSRPQ